MARKETIYSVSKETMFICTSEFSGLKKGDTISNIVDFLS